GLIAHLLERCLSLLFLPAAVSQYVRDSDAPVRADVMKGDLSAVQLLEQRWAGDPEHLGRLLWRNLVLFLQQQKAFAVSLERERFPDHLDRCNRQHDLRLLFIA